MRICKDPSFAKASVSTALRIENPTKHSVNTIDCVSCHIATTARVPVESAVSDGKEVVSSDRYLNPRHNLTRNPNFRTGTLLVHNFGYINTEPIVSQRTINESALAADLMNDIEKE